VYNVGEKTTKPKHEGGGVRRKKRNLVEKEPLAKNAIDREAPTHGVFRGKKEVCLSVNGSDVNGEKTELGRGRAGLMGIVASPPY